jgi:DNA polymerase III delta prime subunit
MTDHETIARLARTLEDHGDRIRALETLEAAAAVSRENMSDNLKSIQSDIRWLIRLVIGALILAVIAFAMDGGFAAAASELPNVRPFAPVD